MANAFLGSCWRVVAVLPLGLMACGAPAAVEEPEEIGCATAAILSGTRSPASALDAIGTLGLFDEQGMYRPLCSATLIAADLVLTAKHCTMTANGQEFLPGEVFFAIGADAEHPRELRELVEVRVSAPSSGGVAQLGSDVGAFRLASPVAGVEPLPLSVLQVEDLPIGSELAVYGYSAVSSEPSAPRAAECGAATDIVRRRGTLALGPHQGNVFDFIYGDYATYLQQAPADTPLRNLSQRYQNGVLLEGYEAWAFDTVQGSQTCHGDSGGPVVLERGRSREIVGVTSWAWQSATRECAYGTVFATFGPQVTDFLAGLLPR
jgi:Trypsin